MSRPCAGLPGATGALSWVAAFSVADNVRISRRVSCRAKQRIVRSSRRLRAGLSSGVRGGGVPTYRPKFAAGSAQRLGCGQLAAGASMSGFRGLSWWEASYRPDFAEGRAAAGPIESRRLLAGVLDRPSAFGRRLRRWLRLLQILLRMR